MLTRRSILRGALAALPLSMLWRRTGRAAGYGPLVPDPAGILDLPAGFSYRILESVRIDGVRQRMSDGFLVPGAPDGMACFPGPDGTLILLRNQELTSISPLGPYDDAHPEPPERYAAGELGGVTRVVVDATSYQRISSNLVLAGTARNCAGGLSPWGWLTCEESYLADHGYVFVCPPETASVRDPQRIVGYGRFEHEAAAVDPATLICYLTEDHGDGCLYRFKPTSPDAPFVGTLQALRIVGRDQFNTSTGMAVGDTLTIDWVDIADPDPVGLDPTTRAQGRAAGAAVIVRGEGLWFHDGAVYFVSTSGGPAGGGQVFRLDPDGDGGSLTLLAMSTDRNLLDRPDNLTVAPWGDVYLAEDGSGDQYLRVLHADGTISDFARNAIGLGLGEFAGVCFAPDGNALFFNLQSDGLTVVVTGPFQTMPPPPDAGVPDAGVDASAPDAGTPGDDDGGGDGCSSSSSEGPAGLTTAVLVAAASLGLRQRPPSEN